MTLCPLTNGDNGFLRKVKLVKGLGLRVEVRLGYVDWEN